MQTLAKWVVIGFIGQWLFTFLYIKKYLTFSWKEWFKPTFLSKISSLIKKVAISVLGVAALQINGWIDAIIARYIDLRGPTYLWYGIRIQQLLLALIGISCVHTITPYLTKMIKNSNIDNAQEIFSRTYHLIVTMMIPCTFAIFGIGLPAVNLLYGRGNYSSDSIVQTGLCLWGYGLGLLPSTLILLFSSIFYAYDRPYIPLRISIITVILNIVLNIFCTMNLECGAFAIAGMTSISSWVNCFLLYRELSHLGWHSKLDAARIMHLICASLFALICCFSIYPASLLAPFMKEPYGLSRVGINQIGALLMQICTFWGSLLVYSCIVKKNDFISCLRLFFYKNIIKEIETS